MLTQGTMSTMAAPKSSRLPHECISRSPIDGANADLRRLFRACDSEAGRALERSREQAAERHQGEDGEGDRVIAPAAQRLGEAHTRVTPANAGVHIPEAGVYGPRLSPGWYARATILAFPRRNTAQPPRRSPLPRVRS